MTNLFFSRWRRWWRFNRLYFGKPPWDTGISPPELRAVIEGEGAMPPGTALDLGCGTGTNVIYLARQGWRVVGVEYVPRAVGLARRKAKAARVSPRFHLGSVTAMPMLQNSFDLMLDMGCFHGLSKEDRRRYAGEVLRLSRPGTRYLLYAFAPYVGPNGAIGVSRAEIESLFRPTFTLEKAITGSDTKSARVSTWYSFRRE